MSATCNVALTHEMCTLLVHTCIFVDMSTEKLSNSPTFPSISHFSQRR